jgi:hypothetical protein
MEKIKVSEFTKEQDKDTASFTRWKFKATVNVPIGSSKRKKVKGVIVKNKTLGITSLYAVRNGQMRLMYCTSPAPTARNTQAGEALYSMV